MALGLACGPAIQQASGTEIPDFSTGAQFSPEQQAGIRAKQDELTKTKDNIELIKAKIAAFEEKIASQKTRIASLTAEIGKKEFETGLRRTARPRIRPAVPRRRKRKSNPRQIHRRGDSADRDHRG